MGAQSLQLCPILCDPMDCSPFCPRDSPGRNTGVGYYFLLQGSSQPRDQTRTSCIGRWILYHWTTRGAPLLLWGRYYYCPTCQMRCQSLGPPMCPQANTWQSGTLLLAVQSPSRVWLFETPWMAASQASLSLTISQSLPKLKSTESVIGLPMCP